MRLSTAASLLGLSLYAGIAVAVIAAMLGAAVVALAYTALSAVQSPTPAAIAIAAGAAALACVNAAAAVRERQHDDAKPPNYGRLIRRGHATLLQQDDYGRLWSSKRRFRQPLRFVEFVNAAPNPDGTHPHHFLPAHPAARTAAEAITLTFRLDFDEELDLFEDDPSHGED